ncbi:MAG TPA: hypothetical protein VMV29_04995 [Ktedonobacterales bacterium]|nr:hypothetical protein [Ktedonobacterales bacterium]
MSNEHDTHEPTGARLTDAQVVAIAGRLADATPGLWLANGCGISVNDDDIADYVDRPDDAWFIAHAPDDVRALLADRAALVADVARLEDRAMKAVSYERHAVYAYQDARDALATTEADRAALMAEVVRLRSENGSLLAQVADARADQTETQAMLDEARQRDWTKPAGW